ncbi:MAG: hypothetical protein EU539_01470 [Promethearchaeota archaeon]|nr:MAG: hypothetical protein EU539_01470 [Candidatus Lokiarchaeota archaeon]
MLESIKNFLFNQNAEIIVEAPSRINLINPLDAVEGDFWCPAVAIKGKDHPLSVFLYIKRIDLPDKIRVYSIETEQNKHKIKLETEEIFNKDLNTIKKGLSGKNKLIFGSIYRLFKTNSKFWKRFVSQNIEIGLLTTIPRQSGLGGSSAIIIATLYGLSKYFKLYKVINSINEKDFPINRDIIAEMATKVEDHDLQIIAGYGDRYTIARGGLGFCSYYGKLHHKELSKEPLAVYDRIDKIYGIDELPIIVCFSGILHESGNVHKVLREAYLANEGDIITNYRKLAEISWKSRFVLMRHDWKGLGDYFKKNTEIMNQIMVNAGFQHGIGLINQILIELIEDHPDVYAAKLTGAGGGGSVFAIVNPDRIDEVFLDWQHRLSEFIKNKSPTDSKFLKYPLEIRKQLLKAKFFRIKINKKGVSILKQR